MSLFGNLFNRNKSPVDSSIVKGYVDLSSTYKTNWWQLGMAKPDVNIALRSATVYTCVSILSQEIARLRITHYRNPRLEGREEMYSSGISRLLNKPNSYQNRSDFFLYLMYSLLMSGNAYAVARKDSRGMVVSLTPLSSGSVQPYVIPDTGEVFYQITSQSDHPGTLDLNTFIPQRMMLHIRLFTPIHPLIGVSPLIANNPSVMHGLSIIENSTKFFDNGSKPSGILSTPKPLTKEQGKRIREAWSSGTTGENTGKVPVLDNDLKFQATSLSAVESQVIEQYSTTKKDIAITYRIPLYMVGEGESNFKTPEAAQRDFVTRSLGFYIEHLETGLDAFFGFNGRTESLEFDVERGIMRPEFNAHIEGIAKGIQGGLFTPDEGRSQRNLPASAGGDKIYMQRQMWPADKLGLDANGLNEEVTQDNTESNTAEDDEELDKSYMDLYAHKLVSEAYV